MGKGGARRGGVGRSDAIPLKKTRIMRAEKEEREEDRSLFFPRNLISRLSRARAH